MGDHDWREEALAEIASIKPAWIEKYGWSPVLESSEADSDRIDLFVHFRRAKPDKPGEGASATYVLRLRYLSDFKAAGRREQFVDPEDIAKEGPQYWPTGANGFNRDASPPTICLEGTFGFHSQLHRDRDGRRASINRLLMEIQKCLTQ